MNRKYLKYLSVLALIGVIYFLSVFYMHDRFLPNTKIGELDVSLKDLQETKDLIKENVIGNYVIQINAIDGTKTYITGKEIELNIKSELESFFNTQNKWNWFLNVAKEQKYPLEYEILFNEDLLDKMIDTCILYQDENIKRPEDAYISDYIPGKGYEIIPETKGSMLMKDKASSEIKKAIKNLENSLSLEEADCYEKAQITKDSDILKEELERKNKTVSATITYDFGNEKIIMTPDIYHDWIDFTEDGFLINEEKAAEYIREDCHGNRPLRVPNSTE